jgi:hypothetical protein
MQKRTDLWVLSKRKWKIKYGKEIKFSNEVEKNE